MSQIDLREIPASKSGHHGQDNFELFARDFLEALGFKILSGPDRGADGGRDLIVQEEVSGPVTDETKRWLVSVKHFAHSGKSVTLRDEPDIGDRLIKFEAVGFIGFYSTIMSSGLSDRLHGILPKTSIHIYDPGRIAQDLLRKNELSLVFRQYCPKAYRSIIADSDKKYELKLITEVGLALKEDDQMEVCLEELLDLSDDGYLRIVDNDIQDIMTACVFSQALRKGRFDFLRRIVSFRPSVWNTLCEFISDGNIDKDKLINEIRAATDSSYLRILILIAGASKTEECVDVICKITLDSGRYHQKNTLQLPIQVTPFFDVVKNVLLKMPESSILTIKNYCEDARKLKKWQEKKVFERGAER